MTYKWVITVIYLVNYQKHDTLKCFMVYLRIVTTLNALLNNSDFDFFAGIQMLEFLWARWIIISYLINSNTMACFKNRPLRLPPYLS